MECNTTELATWIKAEGKHDYCCSNCEEVSVYRDPKYLTPYCPYCGRKMTNGVQI